MVSARLSWAPQTLFLLSIPQGPEASSSSSRKFPGSSSQWVQPSSITEPQSLPGLLGSQVSFSQNLLGNLSRQEQMNQKPFPCHLGSVLGTSSIHGPHIWFILNHQDPWQVSFFKKKNQTMWSREKPLDKLYQVSIADEGAGTQEKASDQWWGRGCSCGKSQPLRIGNNLRAVG